MRRKLLGALALLGTASSAGAQPVPARDLWEFPLGAVAEPAALASEAGTGLWNPASGVLGPDARWRAAAATLSTGAEQGVTMQLAGFAWRRPGGETVSLSVGRAAVDGLVRTDNDPTAIGSIDYASLLASIAVSREVLPRLTVGIAARWREGRADRTVEEAIAADVGVRYELPAWRELRVGAGTFLWRPGREPEDRPVVSVAADALVTRWADDRALRLGYAVQGVTRGVRTRSTTEHGPFATMTAGLLTVRGALPIVETAGRRATRARLGVSLRYNRYAVGVAREDAGAGLGPLYQFTLNVFDQ